MDFFFLIDFTTPEVPTATVSSQTNTQSDPEATQYELSQSVTASGQESAAEPSQQILTLAQVRMSEFIETVQSEGGNAVNPFETQTQSQSQSQSPYVTGRNF